MEYPSLPDIDTTMSYFNDVVDRIPFALGDIEKASPEASFARRFCVQREDMLKKDAYNTMPSQWPTFSKFFCKYYDHSGRV